MKLINEISVFKSSCKLSARSGIYFLITATLAACGGGGGGGSVELPESAIVQTVAAAQVLEGAAGSSAQLEFVVTLDKPAVKGIDVIFSTASTAKTGIDTKEFAKGGASCAAGIDFVTATNAKVSIAKGASTAKLAVTVCGDAVFAPNKTLKINWSAAGSAGGSAIGKIVNDDAGGLNGTGSTLVMGGVSAFGRDANVLTSDPADGALGFSFNRQASCTDDKVSGLTWQKVSASTSTFGSLTFYVNSINSAAPCGFSDWRVPTANELLSLMDASSTTGNAPNADRVGVTDAMTGQFWTNEENVDAPVNAWFLSTDDGGAVSYRLKTDALKIRLVRGVANPVACNGAGFTDLTDGTVTDAKTGLMWKQCKEGLSGTACSAGTPLPFSAVSTITDRLAAVNAASSSLGLGYSDWRIPTRNELASIANRACAGRLAIVSSVFPANEAVSYISATFDANNTNQFWFVNFFEGTVAVGPINAGGKSLRLVRSGQ